VDIAGCIGNSVVWFIYRLYWNWNRNGYFLPKNLKNLKISKKISKSQKSQKSQNLKNLPKTTERELKRRYKQFVVVCADQALEAWQRG